MIHSSKYNAALRALHDILVEARFMAGKAGLKNLHDMLDDAEILPKYIVAEGDNTTNFQRGLESIVMKVPACRYIYDYFDKPDDIAW
jgi:hypothetical protein